jgi:hypothetical protein
MQKNTYTLPNNNNNPKIPLFTLAAGCRRNRPVFATLTFTKSTGSRLRNLIFCIIFRPLFGFMNQ